MPKVRIKNVYIDTQGDTRFVRYADRTYRQHHLAAQFYAKDNSVDDVKAWIKSKPFLRLVDGPVK